MNDFTPSFRALSCDPADRLIEALVAEKNSSEVFHRTVFKASAVDYLTEVNEKSTILFLKNGIVIGVALPLDELKQALYRTDFKNAESFIDLTKVTGPAAKKILAPRLADEFNVRSKEPLIISAILREYDTNNTLRVEFPETAVTGYEVDEDETRSKTGHSIRIHFNTEVISPFNEDEALLDMPYEDFMPLLVDAKKMGLTQLDLCSVFVANPKRYGFDPE